MPNSTYNIRFVEVSKQFGQGAVVDRLNLEAEAGEFVVLLGPSGCGKTTSLRMLAGLEDPTSGDIFVGADRVNDIPTQHRDLALVFQNYALYPHMTVERNIAYPLRIKKVAEPERSQRVRRVAEMLGIGALLGRTPRELSGGERQRVALARAIVREPRAFLMDEPLSNLDAKLRSQMRGELKRLQHDLGTTTIYVTHDQAEAMTLAHRVAVMSGGRLQQYAPPLEIYHQPANRFVAEFVGSPGMNFIEGTVDQGERRFVADGISLPLGPLQLAAIGDRERVALGIRAENIEVSPTPVDGWVAGKVFVVELLGSEAYVFIELGGHRVVARAEADFRAEPETRVWVHLDLDNSYWFAGSDGERVL
jgi:multiple sugar transport system ATP-binding protein